MADIELPPMNVVPVRGGDRCMPGMDHDWYGYSRIDRRSAPEGLPALSFCPIVDLTAVEWERPDIPVPIKPPGGRGMEAFPDVPRMAHHEYGHRVGIFRLIDMLDAAGMPFSLNLDVLTLTHYPRLVELVVPKASEIIAGGLSGSRAVTSLMSEEEEVDYIGRTLEGFDRVLGERPRGWLSPERSNSFRTPQLLAQAGLEYTLDWASDDQPFPFEGRAEGLWSFPLSWELSDVNNIVVFGRPDDSYPSGIVEAAEVLQEHGPGGPRVLGLHLHPWVSGHMFMADIVEAALCRVAGLDRTDVTTPGPVLAAFRQDA
jgi:hypothetical protein